jgi:hypothetical protein
VPLVPWLRPPAATDVGARFLEHTLLLNDVLMGLVLRLRIGGVSAPLAALPFRWFCEDDSVLRFEKFERSTGTTYQSVLKPDAIVDIPGRARRLFLEAETGTQSIATAHPGRGGAIVSKLSRYAAFFYGFAASRRDGETWYQHAYGDAFEARIVFLVHSDERYERVKAAVNTWLASNSVSRFRVLVFTFAEAANVLAPYIANGTVRAPAPRAMRIVTMDPQRAEQLRVGYNELAEALRATRDAVKRHNATPGAPQVALPPFRVELVRALQDFIKQEVSAPAATSGEPQRTGASHG